MVEKENRLKNLYTNKGKSDVLAGFSSNIFCDVLICLFRKDEKKKTTASKTIG